MIQVIRTFRLWKLECHLSMTKYGGLIDFRWRWKGPLFGPLRRSFGIAWRMPRLQVGPFSMARYSALDGGHIEQRRKLHMALTSESNSTLDAAGAKVTPAR